MSVLETAQSARAERPASADISGLEPGQRWFVVQTRSKDERRAQIHLAQQSFRTFLPTMIRSVRHARKIRNVQAAVFPGYLFIILNLDRDRWRSVNGTPGVARLVQAISAPTPVPHGIVEALLKYRDETGAIRFDKDLVEGQAIRIISGPMASAIGTLARLDGNGRVRVLLELMNGTFPVTIERSALEAA